MDAFAECVLLRLPFFKQSVLANRLLDEFWFIFQPLALRPYRIDEIQNKDTSFWRNSIKQLCCPLFFISWRYTFTSLISWIDPWPFWILWQLAVKDGALCACKFKMLKGYASQSHFIGLALQCFTCLCSCVVVPRVALERLPKGRWGIPHETLLQIYYQLRWRRNTYLH